MHNEIEATIQLDTLVMCCTSTIKDNFHHSDEDAFKFSDSFGNTTLSQSTDSSRRYKYCYNVKHENNHIGKIKFGLYGQSHQSDKVWFSIQNKVFYNDTLQFLPVILENLNLTIHNITRMHPALDAYDFDFEQNLRRNLRNKENSIKLMGRNIKDRKKHEKRIAYWHSGSIDNPFNVRAIYIKNKRQIHYSKKRSFEEEEKGENTKDPKTTIGLVAYNKLEEIKNASPHKTYILEYHKAHNPKYKNIYRKEIRLESEELKRYEKKHKRPITVTDLLDKTFLYDMFTEYIDRIIVIRDSKKNKIDLFPKPFLGTLEGKLPLPLPECTTPESDFSSSYKINESNFLNDNNNLSIKVDKKEINDKKINSPKTIYKKNNIKEMRSRQLSQETKNKISSSMKGTKNPNFGKPLSDDHRDKIRNSMLKYWSSVSL